MGRRAGGSKMTMPRTASRFLTLAFRECRHHDLDPVDLEEIRTVLCHLVREEYHQAAMIATDCAPLVREMHKLASDPGEI